jgi:hypothetical protein
MSNLNIKNYFRITLQLPWSRQGRTTDYWTAQLVHCQVLGKIFHSMGI